MADDQRFTELVSLGCHDLRTPLATVYGFARTLARSELEEPAARYVAMIAAAADQLDELIDELAMVARIESGRYEPVLGDLDSLALAREAASVLDPGRAEVSGAGAAVRADPRHTPRALTCLARVASKHGDNQSVAVVVRGAELEISPVSETAAPVLLGERLLELGAAASAAHLRALGGSLEAGDDRLLIRLPEAG